MHHTPNIACSPAFSILSHTTLICICTISIFSIFIITNLYIQRILHYIIHIPSQDMLRIAGILVESFFFLSARFGVYSKLLQVC